MNSELQFQGQISIVLSFLVYLWKDLVSKYVEYVGLYIRNPMAHWLESMSLISDYGQTCLWKFTFFLHICQILYKAREFYKKNIFKMFSRRMEIIHSLKMTKCCEGSTIHLLFLIFWLYFDQFWLWYSVSKWWSVGKAARYIFYWVVPHSWKDLAPSIYPLYGPYLLIHHKIGSPSQENSET